MSDDTLTPEKKLVKLIERIENIVPYVVPTISPNNSFKVGKLIGAHDPDDTAGWMAIHRGRAGSSVQQLESLLRLAKEYKSV